MVFFRYWNYTTYICCDSVDNLEKEITKFLEQEENCHRLFQLPELNCDPEELNIHYIHFLEKFPSLWIVGLFKGVGEWTMIKTFPNGLLCGRALDANCPRLSYLTKNLNCNAFHLEVHQDVDGFLLEADVTGRTFLSGCSGAEAPENFQFYDEQQVERPDLIRQFSLIDVPESMQAAMKINETPEVKKKEAEAARLIKENWDDLDFDYILEALQGHTERIDSILAAQIYGFESFWQITNLARYVYENRQDLEAKNNMRLLYFHPPSTYNPFVMPKNGFPLSSYSPSCDEGEPF